MKRNVSYKKGMPKIELIEHAHIFHSINSQFKEQTYTSTVGGHFHEVKWSLVDGVPTVESVGPPLHHIYVSKPNGQKKMAKQLQWEDLQNDTTVKDNHTHVFQYMHSEELSENSVRAIQQDNYQQRAAEVGLEEVG